LNQPSDLKTPVEAILNQVSQEYIDDCRGRIESFCAQHFSLTGTWQIHRHAFGHDLWKAPANALWAIPYLAIQGLAVLSDKWGWSETAKRLGHVPPGFQTAVSREIEWLIYTEWLQLPIQQDGRQSTHDALLGRLLADEAIVKVLLPELQSLDALAHHGDARQKLQQYLLAYAGSRVAANDLAGSLLSVAAGAATFQQFTPGAVALGTATAAMVAQEIAIANFALGPALGSLYYGVFPASASIGLTTLTIGGLMATLGVLTAFSGLITDPLQRLAGLHQRRLNQLLDALRAELTGQAGVYHLHDVYLARLMDVVDLIRGAVRALR
jgi:hypothetical protein